MTTSPYNLVQYQWKNRIILVFSPTHTDLRFLNQQADFEQHQADLTERDIVVLPIVGPAETRLRNQFRIGVAEFAAILIGKDGVEKHRWSDVAPVEQISYRIDRMPMRKVEARTKDSTRSVS